MKLQDMSKAELIKLVESMQEETKTKGRLLSQEEIEQIAWNQSFTEIERVDYGYGTGVYGPY